MSLGTTNRDNTLNAWHLVRFAVPAGRRSHRRRAGCYGWQHLHVVLALKLAGLVMVASAQLSALSGLHSLQGIGGSTTCEFVVDGVSRVSMMPQRPRPVYGRIERRPTDTGVFAEVLATGPPAF
jgi:hypothetical protein